MGTKKTKKDRILNKKRDHIHLWDLPKSYFPRNTKSKEYLQDLIRTTSSLDYINQKIQYTAQICAFNIKSITQKSGFNPTPPEVFRELRDFVYHYENYCFRLYVYQEKLLHFINAILPVGYDDKDVRIQHILINPVVKQAGLLPLLGKFKQNSSLSAVIGERTDLTHRLYYGNKFDHYFRPKTEPEVENDTNKYDKFKKWCSEWKKEITSRATRINMCDRIISIINNSIAQKIIDYKNSLK